MCACVRCRSWHLYHFVAKWRVVSSLQQPHPPHSPFFFLWLPIQRIHPHSSFCNFSSTSLLSIPGCSMFSLFRELGLLLRQTESFAYMVSSQWNALFSYPRVPSLSGSIPKALYVSFSVCLTLSICLFLSVSLCVSLSASVCLSVCVSLSLDSFWIVSLDSFTTLCH